MKPNWFFLLILLAATPLCAQSTSTLYAEVYWGNLTVEGYSGNAIVWEARHETAQGVTKVTGAPYLDAVETADTLRLMGRRPADGTFESIHLTVKVPYRTAVYLTVEKGGEITVTNVHAPVEIDHRNGSVELSGLRGPAIVHAVNGAIAAGFEALAPDDVLSFVTLNGGISLTLPQAYRATARLRTQKNGYIDSDFDLAGTAYPYAEPATSGGTKPMYSKTPISINAPLNGGGPLLIAMTENGPIHLKKSSTP